MSKKIKLTDGTELTLKELAAPDTGLPGSPPRVMTLLQKKHLNPENVPKVLFGLKDTFGTSVLDVCIERFRELVPRESDREMIPRACACFLANSELPEKDWLCFLPPHFRVVKDILNITDSDGRSVAQELAEHDLLPQEMMTEDILILEDHFGDSVANILARRRYFPEQMMTETILKHKNKQGRSVAYSLAEQGMFPEWAKYREDMLMLGDGKKNLVAHALAKHGLLQLEMMTPKMLKMKNRIGITVFTLLILYRNLTPDILALPWDKKTFVFELLQNLDFRKNQDKRTLKYIDEQIKSLKKIWLTKEQISLPNVQNLER